MDVLINAVDMDSDKIYFNATGTIKVKLGEKRDGVVFVLAYSPMHKEWRSVKVENTYKLKLPSKGELQMADTEEKKIEETVKPAKKSAAVGKIRGLKMLQTWGQVFKEFGTQGIEAVVAAMNEEFPDKAESIAKWAYTYRGYYNMGRLPGVEKPEVAIVWLNPAHEAKREAKIKAAAEKLALKEEKKRIKNEEKNAKKAAREAAKLAKREEAKARAQKLLDEKNAEAAKSTEAQA